jgi:hypothetical protein
MSLDDAQPRPQNRTYVRACVRLGAKLGANEFPASHGQRQHHPADFSSPPDGSYRRQIGASDRAGQGWLDDFSGTPAGSIRTTSFAARCLADARGGWRCNGGWHRLGQCRALPEMTARERSARRCLRLVSDRDHAGKLHGHLAVWRYLLEMNC